jgi:serine/threonine protein kinase
MIRGKLIGEGAYGKIYDTTSTKALLETKCVIKRNLVEKDVDFAGNIRELDLLLRLQNHPNIVKIHHVVYGKAFVETKSSIQNKTSTKEKKVSKEERKELSPTRSGYKDDILHFALEKADMDLYQYIYHPPKQESGTSRGKQLRQMMIDMLLGLRFMHAKRIHHRDIKPSNFLLFRGKRRDKTHYTVKLCDFGLSKIYTNQSPQTPNMCTTWYRAPEIVMGQQYNKKIDIWALGCVFYEMWMRRPFIRCNEDNKEILEHILKALPKRLPATKTKKIKDTYDIALPRGRRKNFHKELFPTLEAKELFETNVGCDSKSFSQLVESMLHFEPSKRPTVQELLEKSFFTDFKDLIEQDFQNVVVEDIWDDIRITIVESPKRSWMMNTVFYFYNEHLQGNLDLWYEDRVIFQAIDLYERFLEYEEKVKDKDLEVCGNSPIKNISEYNSELSTDEQIQAEIQFLVCIYLSIKYFATLYTPISYKEISQDLFSIEGTQEYAKDFEFQLLEKVYQYQVYRPTIYEYAETQDIILSSSQKRQLLIGYNKIKPQKNIPLKEIYAQAIQT